MKKKGLEVEYKVGLFVTIGTALVMLAIGLLGGIDTFVKSYHPYHAHFENGHGLIAGAKVFLNGLRVGLVKSVQFDTQHGDIRIDFLVDQDYEMEIRQDATVEIATQGVLGDKYLEVKTGSRDMGPVKPGSEIRVKSSNDIKKFLTSGEELMHSLNTIANSLKGVLAAFEKRGRHDTFFEGLSKTATNLSEVTDKIDKRLEDFPIDKAAQNLESILDKIDKGNGTLGALVNDPALYDDVKSLIGGANRNRVMRNLVRQAIKDAEEKKKE